MAFNPNELLLEKIRAVEEYDPTTDELMGRYTQIEDPSLTFSTDPTDVTDAMGTPIHTFYRNAQGTLTFTNSLFSMDLAASQFGAVKEVAGAENKIQVPVSETITIDPSSHKAKLKYKPVGTSGSEIKYAKVISASNTFGDTYKVDASEAKDEVSKKTFTLDVEAKELTFADTVKGKVFVSYMRETTKAAKVSKTSDTNTPVRKLIMHVIFHDPCDPNIVYAGIIQSQRAQIDPSSVEIGLASDSKHTVTYQLKKPYCDEETATLVDIIVADEDPDEGE